ncbi:TraR/DksA C4-type zinc finger protein [Acidithiobacillus ferridurans]|uniref:TraR/DksA family transcriptional regulator n=1 Tax=Acidithiobacillus ferridurans TaxID=1232575 RepID=A0A8X8G9P6_ACIFI|nr:TraR/DksA C4-type zinc finger protein [Acidithiobacillus ferridurans]MBU2714597.1 TraR/DksA family transcriptional regulator [Acidithiobacillus ferridurans]MBU2723884.1 TraR/DksA family transcriptional regulator [Acidithiobacillus ferridurans]MBU2726320.1 TraR/DksA family transcriptional regulator [Acidithiobacillus ferridurans]
MLPQFRALQGRNHAGERESAEGSRRYCLDCAEIIPPERVRLVDAVRCVHCASSLEGGSPLQGATHLRRQVGGAIRTVMQREEI